MTKEEMHALQDYLQWWRRQGNFSASVEVIVLGDMHYTAFVQVYDKRRDISWRNYETEMHLNIQDALTALAASVRKVDTSESL